MRRLRRMLVALSGVTVAFAIAAAVLHFTGRFALAEVYIDGRKIADDEAASLGLKVGKSVLSQNCELAAQVMCRRSGIGSANVEVHLPDKIEIKTNLFSVTHLAYDERTRSLVGLDEKLCVTPFPSEAPTLNSPTLIGLGILTPFETPGDFRLGIVLEELDRLKERSEEWHSSVSEIDFTSDEHLTISFNRFEFLALAQPQNLERALAGLFRLVESGELPSAPGGMVDLRFDGLILLAGEDEKENWRAVRVAG